MNWCVPIACLALTAAAHAALADEPVRFNRDVRPILVEKCFGCHGAGAKTRETKLRLDSAAAAERDLGGRRAVVPGQAGESELVRRIFSADAEKVMPPVDGGKPLTPREREMLKRWVEQGAKWEAHWAFIPPQRAPEPAVRDASWPKNFVDSFILAKLEAEGVAPSPEADRRTLLRRLSFDLTGLPPRPQAVEDFVHSIDPTAYEREVVRLIEGATSPQFGERMAAFWLDLVRYADTDGYHADNQRQVWLYRDYVVAAFNDNKPFDRFTREQIAGDLLPGAGDEQRVASAYNRLVKTTEESGANDEEYLLRYAADRVRTTASVWLGLTLGCAECHDHKSDPLKQSDFYRFAACFSDLQEPGVGVRKPQLFPTPAKQAELNAVDQELAPVRAQREFLEQEALAGRDPWFEALKADRQGGQLAWRTAVCSTLSSKVGRQFELRDDRSVVLRGPEQEDEVTVEFSMPPGEVQWLRLEVFRDPEVARELERAGIPFEYYLSDLRLEVIEPGEAPRALWFNFAATELNLNRHSGSHAIDSDPKTSWAVGADLRAPLVRAAFHLDQSVTAGPATRWRARLANYSGVPHGNIRHFRFSMAPDRAWFTEESGVSPILGAALDRPRESWTAADRELISNHLLLAHPQIAAVRQTLDALEARRDGILADVPACLVSVTGPPRVTRVLPRGNWMDRTGPVVTAGVPAVFGPPGLCTNRTDLARWLVARDNPLTARAFVNRLWKLFFGTGLVTTLDDFGITGDSPSHPELLDRLAVGFMDSGWNVKQLVAAMVLSQTYRQASAGRPDLEARDPRNHLFARQGRWRLSAEMIRDNSLRAAGLLMTNLNGPPMNLYQPAGHLDHLDFPKRSYIPSEGVLQYRRGLYAFWQRSFLNPAMAVFDAPSREECVAERPVSNTPLQALALLNSPSHVEAAFALAAYATDHGGPTPAAKVDWIYTQVLARKPDAEERNALLLLYEHQRERWRGQDARVAELSSFGQVHLGPAVPPEEVGAWTAVTRAVLNLHETITRY
ncbi:MAG: PSD1 domain-containing protein [Verrucomicrobia bacterium]|nr:PSD1 domain-containing protein [Verrucomicrobiota bacterium]